MKQFCNLKIFIGFVFLFSISIWSCEKRIPLDTEFPHADNLLFCELIGIPNVGFRGNIMPINKIEKNTHFDISTIKLTIFEDNHIAYSQFLTDSKITIKYVVKRASQYFIKIEYLDQVITSPIKKAAPEIHITSFEYQNEYIDSLDIEVTSVTYTCGGDADSLYYINVDDLVSLPIDEAPFGIAELPKLLLNGKQTSISKHIPNVNHEDYIRSLVLSIDHDAFRYYKLSAQLGSISNDNIDGHQGNLKGGIGYFGLIDFDLEIRKF